MASSVCNFTIWFQQGHDIYFMRAYSFCKKFHLRLTTITFLFTFLLQLNSIQSHGKEERKIINHLLKIYIFCFDKDSSKPLKYMHNSFHILIPRAIMIYGKFPDLCVIFLIYMFNAKMHTFCRRSVKSKGN